MALNTLLKECRRKLFAKDELMQEINSPSPPIVVPPVPTPFQKPVFPPNITVGSPINTTNNTSHYAITSSYIISSGTWATTNMSGAFGQGIITTSTGTGTMASPPPLTYAISGAYGVEPAQPYLPSSIADKKPILLPWRMIKLTQSCVSSHYYRHNANIIHKTIKEWALKNVPYKLKGIGMDDTTVVFLESFLQEIYYSIAEVDVKQSKNSNNDKESVCGGICMQPLFLATISSDTKSKIEDNEFAFCGKMHPSTNTEENKIIFIEVDGIEAHAGSYTLAKP